MSFRGSAFLVVPLYLLDGALGLLDGALGLLGEVNRLYILSYIVNERGK